MAREFNTRAALKQATLWRCPVQGHTPLATPDGLPEPHRGVAEAAGRLTGHCPGTCPAAAARDPDVWRAVRAQAYRDKGSLAVVEPDPSVLLVHAMEAVELGGYALGDWMRDNPRTRSTVTTHRGPISNHRDLPQIPEHLR